MTMNKYIIISILILLLSGCVQTKSTISPLSYVSNQATLTLYPIEHNFTMNDTVMTIPGVYHTDGNQIILDNWYIGGNGLYFNISGNNLIDESGHVWVRQ